MSASPPDDAGAARASDFADCDLVKLEGHDGWFNNHAAQSPCTARHPSQGKRL